MSICSNNRCNTKYQENRYLCGGRVKHTCSIIRHTQNCWSPALKFPNTSITISLGSMADERELHGNCFTPRIIFQISTSTICGKNLDTAVLSTTGETAHENT